MEHVRVLCTLHRADSGVSSTRITVKKIQEHLHSPCAKNYCALHDDRRFSDADRLIDLPPREQ